MSSVSTVAAVVHSRKLLSIVVPAYNEAAGIQSAIQTIDVIVAGLGYRYEFVIVDDGSRDATFDRVAELAESGLPVRALRLSRNFGKEGALRAGLHHAQGDAVITIDADLQHPPALIPEMVRLWESGAKIVHGVKRSRGDEPWLATARAYVVNRLITALGGINTNNSSDFKLLDRVVVDVLVRSLPERNRFYRGLTDWVGFPQTTVHFDVARRKAGQSGWSLRSLLALSLTAMLSFTSAPLRIVSVLGVLTFLLGLGVGSEALISWLRGSAVSGFTTIIITLLLIGSFIMISLGVIGEYIAKIYDETKHRPSFIVDRIHESRRLAQGQQSAVSASPTQRVAP